MGTFLFSGMTPWRRLLIGVLASVHFSSVTAPPVARDGMARLAWNLIEWGVVRPDGRSIDHNVCIRAEWSREADRQMPDRPELTAEERTIIGKRVKVLRRQGLVPAVIYGTLVDEPISVSLDARELYRTYIDYGNISLVDVHLNGDTYTVYIRTVQRDPVSRNPLHAELFAPNLLVRMTASIPIITIGLSPNLDGVVTQLRDSVEVEGLPTDIPGAIEVDVTVLEEIEDTIWAGDLTLPGDVDLLTDEDEALVRLMEVRIELEEPEEDAEALEGAELEEGEEAEEGTAAAAEAEEAEEE